MALVIVATPGSASANSFVTEAEMTAYAEGRLTGSAWTDAENGPPALVEATRDLSVLDFVGSRVTAAQALSWPREWAPNPDAPSIELLGNVTLMYYANTVIPQRIKDATCELALQYLIAGDTDLAVVDTSQQIIESTVDVLTTRWDSGPANASVGLSRFTRVLTLLAPLLSSSGASNVLRLARQ